MPLIRFPTVKGLVYTIDLSKIADRENPRTVEAPIRESVQEQTIIDWGDGESSIVNVGDTTYPSHTYAAEGVYTVVMRSATGHLPLIVFYLDTGTAAATHNISYAVVSVDHFAGDTGNPNGTTGIVFFLRRCINCTYTDTRILGLSKWTSISTSCFYTSSLMQPVESFCFDFII